MAKYGVELNQTGTIKTIGTVAAPGSGMRRIKVYDVMIASDASPADATFVFQVQRTTAAATGTSITPEPLDMADAACVALALDVITVDPTVTAGKIPLSIPMNQRTTFRWVASPGGELVVPATASAGFSFQNGASTATTHTATVHFEEQ